MSSDEARAEAEALSWAEYRNEVAPNPRHAGREAVAFKAGFDSGAGWQAERDAERVAELEAEVAAWIVQADGAGKRVVKLEAEAEHLRAYAEKQDALIHRLRERAEAAEAKLAAGPLAPDVAAALGINNDKEKSE